MGTPRASESRQSFQTTPLQELNSTTHELVITSSYCGSDLMNDVARLLNVSVHDVRLVYRDAQILSETRLEEIGVHDGSTINVLLDTGALGAESSEGEPDDDVPPEQCCPACGRFNRFWRVVSGCEACTKEQARLLLSGEWLELGFCEPQREVQLHSREKRPLWF